MTDFLRVAGAQIDVTVGDIDGNAAKILESIRWAEEVQADVVLLPELAITGYPPEDLVLRPDFVAANIEAVHRIAEECTETVAVVGFVDRGGSGVRRDDAGHQRLHNAAAVLAGGRVRGIYHKVLLPNYGVFDEDRTFWPGDRPATTWGINGVAVGVSVCEDIWVADGPPNAQAQAGADILLNINGSPYHIGKGSQRAAMLADRARQTGRPVVYVNMVGAQDELVFDGESMVFGADGTLLYRAQQFEEELFWVDVPLPSSGGEVADLRVVADGDLLDGDPEPPAASPPRLEGEAQIYSALVTGLRGYVRKNGFTNVVVGLSGGIDSALTATIAADALGPEHVWGITMPSRYSSEGSVEDSRALASNLGIRFDIVPIAEPFQGFLDVLAPIFPDDDPGVAEENLQARVRGTILMAVSNEFGPMVVATGNKSELAVGYATLYGDMAGGFAVLKDVYKTLVYRLARWRNRSGEVIPTATIDKPPSAELRPDQLDTDSLPPYEILDSVLELYIEDDLGVDAIARRGQDRALVARVAAMVDRNEYKRRQAAPGVRITEKGLGRDRRLPITNGYRPR